MASGHQNCDHDKGREGMERASGAGIGGKQFVHVAGAYTDQFGNRLTDEKEPLEQELRLVVQSD